MNLVAQIFFQSLPIIFGLGLLVLLLHVKPFSRKYVLQHEKESQIWPNQIWRIQNDADSFINDLLIINGIAPQEKIDLKLMLESFHIITPNHLDLLLKAKDLPPKLNLVARQDDLPIIQRAMLSNPKLSAILFEYLFAGMLELKVI